MISSILIIYKAKEERNYIIINNKLRHLMIYLLNFNI